MGNFVLIYSGGSGADMSEAQQQTIMAEWVEWYGKLGEAIVDGGNPFGASRDVGVDGVSDGTGTATGYTVISADSLDDAVAKVKDHPHIKHGGGVSVYETFQVGG